MDDVVSAAITTTSWRAGTGKAPAWNQRAALWRLTPFSLAHSESFTNSIMTTACDTVVPERDRTTRSTQQLATLLYIVHRVDGDPHRRIFYELYQDADVFVTHEATPHVRRFLERRQLLVEMVDVARIEPTISHGLLPHSNG